MFNSLSLGRAKGNSTAKSSSDNLSAHPLLASNTPASPSDSGFALASSNPNADEPKPNTNLPYKPRQRHGAGSGSGGGSVSNPLISGVNSSQSVPTLNVIAATKTSQPAAVTTSAFAAGSTGGSVTSRLQLQSLKAAGQRMGLGNGTAGIQVLETIFEKGQVGRTSGSGGGDWGEILKVLTTGQATLLLPSSSASSLPVTTHTLRDHILFSPTDAAVRNVVVTMSGLVGRVEEGKIVFDSCLTGDNALLQALKDPGTRSMALSTLHPLGDSSSKKAPYPNFNILDKTGTLPFPSLPPPPSSSTGTRSRSGSTASLASIPPIASSRLNPFASFFGGAGGNSPNTPPKANAKHEAPSDSSSSPSTRTNLLSPRAESILSLPSSETSHEPAQNTDQEGFQIPAWSVDKVIKHTEVCKSLEKALKREVTDELEGLPDKVVERVVRFVLSSHPCSVESKVQPGAPLLGLSGSGDVPLQLEGKPDATGEGLQRFMESIYDDLRTFHIASYLSPQAQSPSTLSQLRRRGSQKGKSGSIGTDDNEKAAEEVQKREKQKLDAEEAAEILADRDVDLVEKVVCTIFYNSLFMPVLSDDTKHDKALSSRALALNRLDLSLDHLGVKTKEGVRERDETVAKGLENIVVEVGKVLQSLEHPEIHAPKAKSNVFITAHKVVIDGLQHLPSIRLRPEGDPYISPDASPDPNMIVEEPEGQDSLDDSSVPPLRGPSLELNNEGPISSPSSRSDSPGRTPKAANTIQEPPNIPEIHLPDSFEQDNLQEALQDSIMLSSKPTSAPAPKSDTKLGGTSSGADLLLPIIIYAIVKANPERLVSHLLYTQRYRAAICSTGEAQYAVVNMTAAVEFLENVDLADLGLSSETVLSVTDLEPIGLTNYYNDKDEDTASIVSASSRLRGRVTQVGEFAGSAAGSANKVLTGVVDSSWTALRGLMVPNLGIKNGENEQLAGGELTPRPKMNPRRASAFTLANVTATVANIANATTQRQRAKTVSTAPSGPIAQELHTVSSRPQSIREIGDGSDMETPSEHEDTTDDEDTEGADDIVQKALGRTRQASDTRSIRSVSSMLAKPEGDRNERLSIHERFANMGLNKQGGDLLSPNQDLGKTSYFKNNRAGPHSRRTTLLNPMDAESITSSLDSPTSITSVAGPTWTTEELAPPVERFMEGNVADLRISDIGALLRDYRRMGDVIKKLRTETMKESEIYTQH